MKTVPEGVDPERLFWVNPLTTPESTWHIALMYAPPDTDDRGLAKTICVREMSALCAPYDPSWERDSLLCFRCLRGASLHVQRDQMHRLYNAAETLRWMTDASAVTPMS